jgi:hypothetical protein
MKQEPWYEREMAGAVLPDQRFRHSLPRLVASLARRPGQSWSRALGHAGRQSARRLGRRMKEDYRRLLEGHFAATAERARAYPTVLAVQDTTVDNYFGHRAKQLGPIDDDADGNGLLAHTCLAVSGSGVPLGLLHLDLWVRDRAAHGQKAKRRVRRPEDKESARWRETAEVVGERLPDGPEVFIIEDREGDNFHFLSVPRRSGCHLLCRMAQARSVIVPGDGARRNLLQVACAAPVVGHSVVEVATQRDARGRVKHRARRASLTLQVQEMEIQAPQRLGVSAAPVRVWVVRAAEPAPPAGVSALEWVLLCTKPVETGREAQQMADYYSQRWKVERLHYVLKSGLGIEELQIVGRGELQCALALKWVVAWRMLWLTHQLRDDKAAPAAGFLSAEELLVLRVATGRAVVSAEDVARAVAKLGGAEEWRNAPMPGEKRLWMGLHQLQTMLDYHRALEARDARHE